MQRTTLLITYPDGWQRAVAIGTHGLRIGRAPDNDLVISVPGVAAYHAIIRCDHHGRTRVADATTNGVITIDMPANDDAGAAVRIGGYTIRMGEGCTHHTPDPAELLRELLTRTVGSITPGPSAHDSETLEWGA